MAESKIEVRLVRCPKCENLLPEPKDCSFFKCGGCGTVLCAKNKNREADSVSDNNNRVKETEVSEEESDSHASLRHQRETLDNDVHSDSQSGLDRFRKRNDSEDFFRFSNYFSDSISSDEAIKQDRAGLVRKLDNLKEQLLLQPKDQQHIPRFENAAQSRFFSSGRNATAPSYYHHHYQEPESPCNAVSPHGLMQNPAYRAHPHYSRLYTGGNGHDFFDTHPRNGVFHQSTCSCYRYDPYCRASGSVIPPSGLPDALYNRTGFGPSHSPRSFIPPPGSQSRALSRVRCPKARLIRSLAGGAPFITCRNCSKILKLPEETDSVTRKKKQRLRCGACSCTMEFSFLDKKLVLLSTDSGSVKKEETRSNLHYEFESVDKGGIEDLSSVVVSTISEKAQEMQIEDSTSRSVSEDELSSDSSLHERFEFSSIKVHDWSEVKNRSTRSEQERVLTLSKRQNSMKEASVAIEMDDVSFNESEVSQDSANDENRDDQVRRTKKNGFTSLMKNSFKDLKKSIQSSSDVSVNGNHIPERLVKLAEKQAGPIRPGNYWYDYRAGFWGVMGGHCLGILPPFIEELNHPMPEKCANGNTRVFINGRELHQKDLRLLAARGLPRDKDRSYTVYISGRVIDEETGEELNSLGKLAPTVDKLKRGFGMRVPRRAV